MSEGELQAVEKLSQAARLIGSEPAARSCGVPDARRGAGERNNTIVLRCPSSCAAPRRRRGRWSAARLSAAVTAQIGTAEIADKDQRQLAEGRERIQIARIWSATT